MAELSMLADGSWFNHKAVIHPANSLAQDRESLLAETSVLLTTLCRQHIYASHSSGLFYYTAH